jgi:hypothetical protein
MAIIAQISVESIAALHLWGPVDGRIAIKSVKIEIVFGWERRVLYVELSR